MARVPLIVMIFQTDRKLTKQKTVPGTVEAIQNWVRKLHIKGFKSGCAIDFIGIQKVGVGATMRNFAH